jgi:hypothetical protein
MTRAQTRAASRKDAKYSRTADVRSRGRAGKQRHGSCARALTRSRRDIDATVRLVDRACRMVDDAERAASARPIQASRQFKRVSGSLAHAATLLERAGRGMQDTTAFVVLAPDLAGDAPQQLVDTSIRFIDAAVRLAAISDRVHDASTGLLDAAERGDAQFDPSELTVKTNAVVAAPRSMVARLFPAQRPRRTTSRSALDSISRQLCGLGFAPATTADAARRVSRGRAPPFVSTCKR